MRADIIASAADPSRTFLQLIEPGMLPIAFEESIANVRCRGTLAKVHIADKPDLCSRIYC